MSEHEPRDERERIEEGGWMKDTTPPDEHDRIVGPPQPLPPQPTETDRPQPEQND